MRTRCQPDSASLPASRWLAYATASLATAVCSAPCADAEIHYSGVINVPMKGIRSMALPLVSGASLFFEVTACDNCYPRGFFTIRGADVGSARASYSSRGLQFLANLDRGIPVSTGRFGSVARMPSIGALLSYSGQGNFGHTGTGVIGFKFDVGNGVQYGWARLKVVRSDTTPYQYLIKDYAWGDVGDRIETGQRRSTDGKVSILPQFSSLGLLALGAVGLTASRRHADRLEFRDHASDCATSDVP